MKVVDWKEMELEQTEVDLGRQKEVDLEYTVLEWVQERRLIWVGLE